MASFGGITILLSVNLWMNVVLCQDFVFPTDEAPTVRRTYSSGLSYEELRQLNASCHPKDTCMTRGRRIDDIRDQTCGCDNSCTVYDNCCIDARVRKPPFLSLLPKRKFSCLNYMNVGSIYIKETCPPHWTGPVETVHKCQTNGEEHSDPLSIMPATNKVSGISYKNYYCAECNSENATSIVIWQPLVEFTNLKSYNASYGNVTADVIKDNLAYNPDTERWGLWLYGDDNVPYFYDSTIYPTVPRGLEERVHPCRPELIGHCHRNWSDPIVEKKCKAYQGAIYVRGSTNGYRNAHCALCNFENTRKLTCTAPKGKAGFQARTFNNEAFSVLLDFHGSNGGSVGTNSQCPEGKIYDPFHKKCKKILCGFPWLVVKNNKCVPIQTSPLSNRDKIKFPVNDQPTSDSGLEEKSLDNFGKVSLFVEKLESNTTFSTLSTNESASTTVTTLIEDNNETSNATVPELDILNSTDSSNVSFVPLTTNISQTPPTINTIAATTFNPDTSTLIIDIADPLHEEVNASTTSESPFTSDYPYALDVTHSPNGEFSSINTVFVEATTQSTSEIRRLTETTKPVTPDTESTNHSSIDELAEKSTVSYDETRGNNDILQVVRLTTTTPTSNVNLQSEIDSNSTPVKLEEPPQNLDYEDNRQYVAESNVQYDYSEEFINCTKIGLEPSEYVLFSNGTLYVPAFGKTYDKRNYFVTDEVLVCAFFANATTGAVVSKFSKAMGYITFVGLGVSIICLVLHLIVYLLVPDMRNLSTNNLAALSLSLLLAYVAFITGQFSTISKNTCLTVAGASYFFFLASFFWMSAMSFDVWRTLRLATKELRVSNGRQWKRFLGYSVYSWGLPMVALIAVIVVDTVPGVAEEYRPRFGVRSCWFDQRESLLVFFAAPLIVIMVLNIVMFISSAKMVLTTTRSTNKNYSCTTSSRRNFKLYLRLAVMMGLTWILGLVAGYLNVEAIWYVFIFLNTLQGLFIFVAFSCNRKVKKHLGERMQALTRRRAYRTSSLNSNSTFPSSVMQRTNTVTSTSSLTSEIKTPPPQEAPANQRPVAVHASANQRPVAVHASVNQKPVASHPPVSSFQQLQDGMETLY